MKQEIFEYIKTNLGIDEQEIIDELFSEYLSTCKELIAAIERDLAAGDCPTLTKSAHSLKGCAGNIGHRFVYDKCLAIETTARSGSTEGCAAWFDDVKSACQALTDEA